MSSGTKGLLITLSREDSGGITLVIGSMADEIRTEVVLGIAQAFAPHMVAALSPAPPVTYALEHGERVELPEISSSFVRALVKKFREVLEQEVTSASCPAGGPPDAGTTDTRRCHA